MGKDLGTYFVRVTLWDGRGWISSIHTGWRFTNGSGDESPLNADPISPTWEDEDELIQCLLFQYQENNWSCDCNRRLDLHRAYQLPEPEDGDNKCSGSEATIRIKRFEILNPKLEVVFSEEPFESPGTP